MAYYSKIVCSEELLRHEDRVAGKLQKRMEMDVKLESWIRTYCFALFPSTKRKAKLSVFSPAIVICRKK